MSDGTLAPTPGSTVPAACVEFLTATVEAARAIFHAKAASIMLVDPTTDELVFEAVAGEGSQLLLGRRIPATIGIAGSVLSSAEPAALRDVASDPRFATEVADASGYVPTELMAAPLVRGGRRLGVIEVLDRPQFSQFSLVELDMLKLLAAQTAIGLDLAWQEDPPAGTAPPA
jgi:GAF domain-containing protein